MSRHFPGYLNQVSQYQLLNENAAVWSLNYYYYFIRECLWRSSKHLFLFRDIIPTFRC